MAGSIELKSSQYFSTTPSVEDEALPASASKEFFQKIPNLTSRTLSKLYQMDSERFGCYKSIFTEMSLQSSIKQIRVDSMELRKIQNLTPFQKIAILLLLLIAAGAQFSGAATLMILPFICGATGVGQLVPILFGLFLVLMGVFFSVATGNHAMAMYSTHGLQRKAHEATLILKFLQKLKEYELPEENKQSCDNLLHQQNQEAFRELMELKRYLNETQIPSEFSYARDTLYQSQ